MRMEIRIRTELVRMKSQNCIMSCGSCGSCGSCEQPNAMHTYQGMVSLVGDGLSKMELSSCAMLETSNKIEVARWAVKGPTIYRNL